MADKTSILTKINDKYSKLSKGQRIIASFVIDNLSTAVFMTAAQIASSVGVSESTVVRFATALDFDGFPTFQKALEEYYREDAKKESRFNIDYTGTTKSPILNSVLKADVEKITDTINNLDENAFELAVDIITKAKKVYVVGLRTCEPLAEFLAFYLNMIRPDVVLLKTTSASEMFEQMIRIDDKDCIIGISFPRYSMRTLKAMEFANDRNAKVITLTDSVHSPMNLYSSCNLLARTDMISIVDSLVAPLSVINALIVALCHKHSKAVAKNLETLEDAWSNYQIYLNDEINFINDEPILDYSLNKDGDI